ncbi:nucleic acid-binding protein [Gonapodya prolifera JEL478]|uniref:Nucleic acid-binding protein n=1 Tax=Gonapodya prolifera (strain JEL478) TaxID=1344416 RepID=A0A139A9W9_GONPJ|nr:nucleic acid-binding protein [Gonapodya prolifera JEL478]|eukprot:KXS13488.1 nucleic acid-binding protein [Gonapodya prolifera JEL478]
MSFQSAAAMFTRFSSLASPVTLGSIRRAMSAIPEDVNKVTLVGRVVEAPSYFQFQKGSTSGVTTFRMVTVEHIKAGDKEWDGKTFHTVKCFQASLNDQILGSELQPGNVVHVEGKLRADQWTSKDGAKRSRTVVELGKAATFKVLSRESAPVSE